MIAKIVAFGASRDEARRKLIHGLERSVAFGVTTNRAFLAACLRHPAFAAGEATTGFIAQHRDQLAAPGADDGVPQAAVAALLLYVTERNAAPWRKGRSLAAVFPTLMRIEIDGKVAVCEVFRDRDGGYVTRTSNNELRFEIDELGADTIRFRADNLAESATFHRDGDRLFVQRLGVSNTVRDLTRAAPARATAAAGDGKLRAAMNGRVVAVLVKAGERVEAGQPVLTLEAMKMEHVHAAPISGIIAIDVEEGEQVTTGRIVAEIEAVQQAAQ
jgi:geranyl-CoA carboxylase alpha subunit